MSDYFYNKEIILLEETDGHLYHGVWQEGTLMETKTISCDVQPSNREQIFKDYGYYIDCVYRIFCDVDKDIQVGNKVKYNGNIFEIKKIIPWDDYYDMFINEVAE